MNTQLNRLVVNASAVMASCLGKAGFEKLEAILTSNVQMLMSAPTWLELGVVAANRNIQQTVNETLVAYQTRIEPFTHDQAIFAIDAFTQHVKGRYSAELNFVDCCAYALAKSLNLPLLYKGNDFAQTDIASALA